jgi:hypothetical protein
VVGYNAPHQCDGDLVHIVYAAAKPTMRILADRFRVVSAAIRDQGAEFEPAGAAIWRVLKEVNQKRKEGNQS